MWANQGDSLGKREAAERNAAIDVNEPGDSLGCSQLRVLFRGQG
jgi:hypothetical protein